MLVSGFSSFNKSRHAKRYSRPFSGPLLLRSADRRGRPHPPNPPKYWYIKKKKTPHFPIMKTPESLRRPAVMLVYFRQAVRKIVKDMVNRVRKRQLDHFLVRKNFFYLSSEMLVHAVIIIRIKKAAVCQIRSQSFRFALARSEEHTS